MLFVLFLSVGSYGLSAVLLVCFAIFPWLLWTVVSTLIKELDFGFVDFLVLVSLVDFLGFGLFEF